MEYEYTQIHFNHITDWEKTYFQTTVLFAKFLHKEHFIDNFNLFSVIRSLQQKDWNAS